MRMTRRDASRLAASRQAQRDHETFLAKQRDKNTSGGLKMKGAKSLAITALETGAGAAAFGWLAGRMGTTGIGGVSLPLGGVAGLAGLGLVAFDVLPGWAESHVAAVSNGALAAWLALWGAGQGGQSRAKAGAAPGGIIAGNLPPHVPVSHNFNSVIGYRPPAPQVPAHMLPLPRTHAMPLTEAELVAMAQAMPLR